jgi:hypothetical protein
MNSYLAPQKDEIQNGIEILRETSLGTSVLKRLFLLVCIHIERVEPGFLLAALIP